MLFHPVPFNSIESARVSITSCSSEDERENRELISVLITFNTKH